MNQFSVVVLIFGIFGVINLYFGIDFETNGRFSGIHYDKHTTFEATLKGNIGAIRIVTRQRGLSVSKSGGIPYDPLFTALTTLLVATTGGVILMPHISMVIPLVLIISTVFAGLFSFIRAHAYKTLGPKWLRSIIQDVSTKYPGQPIMLESRLTSTRHLRD